MVFTTFFLSIKCHSVLAFLSKTLSLTGVCSRRIQGRVVCVMLFMRDKLRFPSRRPNILLLNAFAKLRNARVLTSASLSGITVTGIAGRGVSFTRVEARPRNMWGKCCRPKRKLASVKLLMRREFAATLIPGNRAMGFTRVR